MPLIYELHSNSHANKHTQFLLGGGGATQNQAHREIRSRRIGGGKSLLFELGLLPIVGFRPVDPVRSKYEATRE